MSQGGHLQAVRPTAAHRGHQGLSPPPPLRCTLCRAGSRLTVIPRLGCTEWLGLCEDFAGAVVHDSIEEGRDVYAVRGGCGVVLLLSCRPAPFAYTRLYAHVCTLFERHHVPVFDMLLVVGPVGFSTCQDPCHTFRVKKKASLLAGQFSAATQCFVNTRESDSSSMI